LEKIIQDMYPEIGYLPEELTSGLSSLSKDDLEYRALLRQIALSFAKRGKNNSAEDFEKAIEYTRMALEKRVFNEDNNNKALLHFDLARHYYSRISGQNDENLEIALQECKAALELFKTLQSDYHEVVARNFLALIFSKRIRENRKDNLEKAIETQESVLKLLPGDPADNKALKEFRAKCQSDLGTFLQKRISGNRNKNIDRAIECFNSALEVFDQEASPENWGMVQHNLGTAYLCRWHGDRAQNQESAINHYKQALLTRTREVNPAAWSDTQNNLGLAYRERILGDSGENYEMALQHYLNSLEECCRDTMPFEWADTQKNIGSIYKERILGNPSTNLEESIRRCNLALEVFNKNTYPAQWAELKIVLGLIYQRRAVGRKKDNCKYSLSLIEEATEVFTRENYPIPWAICQNNLGFNYLYRDFKNSNEQDCELAIKFFKKALEVYNRDSMALHWADANRNIGIAMVKLAEARDGDWSTEALDYLSSALEVYQALLVFHKVYLTAGMIAGILIKQKKRPEAVGFYQIARKADQKDLQQSVIEKSRQRIFKNGSTIFYEASYNYAASGNYREALEWLETGKMRALSEKMKLNRVRLEKISPDHRKRYLSYMNRLRTLETSQISGKVEAEKIAEEIRHINRKTDELIQEIRRYQPEFLTHGNPGEAMETMITHDNTLIMEFNVTRFGTVIFLLSRDSLEMKIDIVFNDTFKLKDLERLTRIWQARYREFSESNKNIYECQTWGTFILNFMDRISRRVLPDKMEIFTTNRFKRLILIPHLALHVLPLHLLSFSRDDHQVRLMDEFEVSFSPGLSVLRYSRADSQAQVEGLLGIVAESPDLKYPEKEIEVVSSLFGNNAVQITGKDINIEKIMESSFEKKFIHFACHGRFDMNDPYKSFLTTGSGDDARLTLKEIFRKFRCDLSSRIVLSSCESGQVAAEGQADEVVGFPSGFLYSGACSVVSGLWPISDAAARFLMEHFYRFILENHMSLPQALKAAQQKLRDTEEYENPFYWAAFQVTGDVD